jgi:hypothetical protein
MEVDPLYKSYDSKVSNESDEPEEPEEPMEEPYPESKLNVRFVVYVPKVCSLSMVYSV